MRTMMSGMRAWVALLVGLTFAGMALADPPARVARLSLADGAVSFSPAGEDEWVEAPLNRPLVTGDRLWADAGARAELEIGSAALRLGAATSVAILNLDDRIAQFQLTQGSLNLRVRSIEGDEIVEIDTPNLALSVRRAGEYRIDVDGNGDATMIAVRGGNAEVYGDNAGYLLEAGQWARFQGVDLYQREFASLPARDDLDRWSLDRDRRHDASRTARYVSPEVIGYADLDDYGNWEAVQGYGNVWIPTRVATDWAPYREGHWAWVEPWGWTWVDDAPWGFAPFHYGRWAYVTSRWCWVPGPRVRPVYAPALVAFAGGGDFRLSIASGPSRGIAWFPLAPGEVYRPPYRVSRNYFNNVNVSNTRVDRNAIGNVYSMYSGGDRDRDARSIIYANRSAPGGITAVPQAAFAQAQHIGRAAVPLPREAERALQPMVSAPIIPAPPAVTGTAGPARGRPPTQVLSRPVIAREVPPPAPRSFAARQPGLALQPGQIPVGPPPIVTKPADRTPQGPQVRVVPRLGAPVVQPAPVVPAAPPLRGDDGARGRPQAAPAAPPITSVPPAVQPGPLVPRPPEGGAPTRIGPRGPASSTAPLPVPQAQPRVVPPQQPESIPQGQPQPQGAPPLRALPVPQATPQPPSVPRPEPVPRSAPLRMPEAAPRVAPPSPPVSTPAPPPMRAPEAARVAPPLPPVARPEPPRALPPPPAVPRPDVPRAAPPPPPPGAPAAPELRREEGKPVERIAPRGREEDKK